MRDNKFIYKIMITLWLTCIMTLVHAGMPLWTFRPLTATTITIAANNTATVSYQITNQSQKTHRLVLSSTTPTGITQTSGPCVLAAKSSVNPNSMCTLTLNIDGGALPSDNVSGGPILCQTNENNTPNPNQCYQPSLGDTLVITRTAIPGTTTLNASTSQLALSITGLTEYGVSGSPVSGVARIITITNTGSNPAVNLSVTLPTFPAGTSSTTTCSGNLPVGDNCTITISPGATATSDGTNPCTSGTTPNPGVVQVSADNATSVSTNAIVLGYGCIYQGGYVYAFDDTTPITGSVGGKVVTISDQAAPSPNGIVWSSNGGPGSGSGGTNVADTSYDTLPGIDETSTSTIGSPTYAAFTSFFSTTYNNPNPFTSASFGMCSGMSDGACNTSNILTLYNQFITHNKIANGDPTPFTATAGPTNITYYAAGLCKQTISGYLDWYLPAICEMGYGSSPCGISGAPTLQNIQSSLIDISAFSTPSGQYWSSTAHSSDPNQRAMAQSFASGGGSFQIIGGKTRERGVRCSRILTL